MSINKIVEEIRKTYHNHDRLDEIVDDLSNGNYIDFWANNLCNEEFNKNYKLAKELYKISEISEDVDYVNLASSVANSNTLNDKDWATELFKKAIDKYSNNYEIINIADAICKEEVLNDKDWATSLYRKYYDEMDKSELDSYNRLINSLKSTLEDEIWANKVIDEVFDHINASEDVYEFAGYASNLLDFTDHINDSEKLKSIFEILKTYEGVTDLLDSARKIKELLDDDYVQEYIDDIIALSIENVQEGYYCDIYSFIKYDLEDDERADEFKDQYENEMRSDFDEYGSCEDLFGNESSVDLEDIDFNDYEDRNVLIAISCDFLSDLEDIDNQEDRTEIASERIEEFISELSEKLQDNLSDRKLISPENSDNDVVEFNEGLERITFESTLFVVVTKDIPLDVLNTIFLDLSDYSFYANILQDNGDFLCQGYDCGEYNTGWFSHGEDDSYINEYSTNLALVAKDKLGL